MIKSGDSVEKGNPLPSAMSPLLFADFDALCDKDFEMVIEIVQNVVQCLSRATTYEHSK